MSQTYKATGIILKSMPLGEADKLLTILTKEFGLIRAVAPGSRKHKSKLGGRSSLFVVNELLLAKGRTLDKITQAETLESYPGLSKNLGKLAASQYLAELALCYGLSEQPQEELYELINEHLRRLGQLPTISDRESEASSILAHLSQGIFHLLALAGIAPQVRLCCVTQNNLQPDYTDPEWRVGFSVDAGGTISLAVNELEGEHKRPILAGRVLSPAYTYNLMDVQSTPPPRLNTKLDVMELTLLQHLAEAQLSPLSAILPEPLRSRFPQKSVNAVCVKVERVLRDYAQYHFGRTIRSAVLVDTLSIPDF